ncbi:MAG: thioether cross-link-forming SCIFF peptide maturase [Lachnospiraceae bacterium]|jgi:uncharacterized protein|nr:thioether cross-link-forming SCIFF peptide maturase [Lachnospiraceae bacterium]
MVHQFTDSGENIVLDVESGAIHVVSDVAGRLIPFVQKALDEGKDPNQISVTAQMLSANAQSNHPEDVTEAWGEIITLYRSGQLFSSGIAADLAEKVSKRKPIVKALCLNVTHTCNLACRYCFAEKGKYQINVNDSEPKLMSVETACRAIDFLVENAEDRVHLEIDFFGGEPLLSWETIKEAVSYARGLEATRGKVFRFTLTTNGLLLTEAMFDFINREMENVILSIDGRREINDAMRPKPCGGGSYDDIIDCFMKLAVSREQKNYFLRGTFTRYNLDFSEDVRHLADLGFTRISLEPVVTVGDEDYTIRSEDVPAICDEYDKLAGFIIDRHQAGKPIDFFHFMVDLAGGPCLTKRLGGCGAGSEYLAVTPGGKLYPCHQFVGNTAFCIGNLDDGIVNDTLGDEFRAVHVFSKPECRSCFARYYCSGGCAANSFRTGGSICAYDEIACALERKRVEKALACAVICERT